MGRLEIRDVHVWSGKRIYLNQISFFVDPGKTLFLVGESGSGKTMLSRLMVGQRPDDAEISGHIFLEGRDLLSLNHSQWKKYRGNVIAYLAQNPMALFNQNQTVGSHAIELFKSRLSLSGKEGRERMKSALSSFNLKQPEEIMGKYPFQLSGGMLQRIMFAMVLELSPEILIADEPTSALDRYNTRTVIDTLKRCKDKGCSLVVITHDYELVKEVADDVIIMKDGRIVEMGTADEILQNPSTEYARALMRKTSYLRYGKEENDV